MRNISKSAAFALAVLQIMGTSQALAQATRTWVSGVGDDANPCSRTAPCKTFAGAISKTAAGGEINTLDPGAYGTVTITKSITIRSDHLEAGVLASSTNGITINAGASDRVVLEGLDIEGAGSGGATGLNGIRVLNAGSLLIVRNSIRNFMTGIDINSGSQLKIAVQDNIIANNSVAGISVAGAGTGHLKLDNNLLFSNPAIGLVVNGAGNDAVISNNQIYSSTPGMSIINGATVKSFGGNLITSGDSPTTTAPKI